MPGAVAWGEDQKASVVALLAHVEEECIFVKKQAVVVWAWFLLAARYTLRGSIGSVIAFSMLEIWHEGERGLITSLFRLHSNQRQACH